MAESYLRFWGVRGSYPAPFPTHIKVGGNTSCVEINVDGHVLVCDAGTGIIPLGNKIVKQATNKNLLIILTHYHWDHICGLPFFTPAFIPDWNIDFFAPGESAQEIKQNIDSQMQSPYFPVGTETWMANINYLNPKEKELHHGPMEITNYSVHHPGITYGYQIKVGDKRIIYVSDNECQFLDKTMQNKIAEFSKEEQQMFVEMNREEYEYELNVIQSADILIHDAQYTPKDYADKCGWGHSCYVDVVNYAIDADVKELYLFHHDPSNDDAAIEKIYKNSQEIIESRDSPLKCHIAREGLKVKF